MKKILIFDFDGVIHDTFEFHRRNLSTFIKREITTEEFKKLSDGNIFEEMPLELKEVRWNDYENFVKESHAQLRVDSEIKEILISLAQQYQLSIISSGHQGIITSYLQDNELVEIFDKVLGMETHRSKVEKCKLLFSFYGVEACACVFITDTLGDILEAREVNLETFALDSGYHERGRILKGRPTQIISHLREVRALLNATS